MNKKKENFFTSRSFENSQTHLQLAMIMQNYNFSFSSFLLVAEQTNGEN
jgi:hypothetical protein